MLGFETIGNATAIFYDGKPWLVTDPWILGGAYYGSWGRTHEIPAAQMDAIAQAPFAWISHGHPDHLNAESLDILANKTVLLADHAGGRIARDLREQGFTVRVLPSRRWFDVTPNLRVQTIPDYNQDSILLAEINGDLVLDLNDASDRGWGAYVRRLARHYENVFVMRIGGYGDATMINFKSEDGSRIVPPHIARNKETGVGRRLLADANRYNANISVPFSSLHRYQREDSVWANEHVAPLSEYSQGFDSDKVTLTKPFLVWDAERKSISNLTPAETDNVVRSAGEFGDNWSDQLDADEIRKVEAYFRSRLTSSGDVGFLRVRVGGHESTFDFGRGRPFGYTLEVPRSSLMSAIEYEVFDDLFIGNFMSVTLHAEKPLSDYPTSPLHNLKLPLLYGDNGMVRDEEDLRKYFRHYAAIMPFEAFKFRVTRKTESVLRSVLKDGTPVGNLARRAYHHVRSQV